jgi:hypothetical protein
MYSDTTRRLHRRIQAGTRRRINDTQLGEAHWHVMLCVCVEVSERRRLFEPGTTSFHWTAKDQCATALARDEFFGCSFERMLHSLGPVCEGVREWCGRDERSCDQGIHGRVECRWLSREIPSRV